MIDSMQYLFIAYVLCIIISAASLVVTLFFIVPLQLKKAGVQNGLSSLRHKQLAKGVLSLLMSSITMFVLTSRFFIQGDAVRILNTTLIVCFTLFWFLKELIESSIYHTQFTEDQIELHHKIHKEEVRVQDVAKRREVARVKLNSDRRQETLRRNNLTH